MKKYGLDCSLYRENRREYFAQIEELVRKRVKKSRFRHTLGVAHTAACMAMRYDENPDRAYLAGLLHDAAKSYSDKEMLDAAADYGLGISDFEAKNPFILHGKVAAGWAAKDLGITDTELLSAISYHTTGKPDMTTLEKIIFLADYLENGRDEAPDLPKVRALAFRDLDACLLTVLTDTLAYLENAGRETDEMTMETYRFYAKQSTDQ